MPPRPTRRALLRAAAVLPAGALLARARPAAAIGPSSKFRFAQLQLGGGWQPRPDALRRLAWELEKRTSIDAELEPVITTLGSPSLHDTPLLYLAGDRGFDLPPQPQIEALRRFLTFGGTLIVDSAEGGVGGAFDQAVRRLLAAALPAPAPGLEVVAPDHVAFTSFYLLDRPVGRVAISAVMEAQRVGDRLAVMYVQNDLGGAWSRDNFGTYQFTCEPGGEAQREQAFRLGVNLVMYTLCLDYKTDQVHVPFIMRRRRWKPADGGRAPSGAGSGTGAGSGGG
ncbi:MAG: DUF4159 domain-containing protein [Kofleriaceae bacterium]